MSTIADIREAKAAYDDHVGQHKCGYRHRCAERIRLWQTYMRMAARWGLAA